MTAYSPVAVHPGDPVFRAVAEIIDIVTGAGGSAGGVADTGAVRPTDRLEADLRLDSVEVAALDQRLVERFGPGVALAPMFAALDLAQLIGLTVADLAAHVARNRAADRGLAG